MSVSKMSIVSVLLFSLSAVANTREMTLPDNDWGHKGACLTNLLNSLPQIGKRVKRVGFPELVRDSVFKGDVGYTVVMEARQGMSQWLNVKMKSAPGSLFHGYRAGSPYYPIKVIHTIVLDPQTGLMYKGEAQCEAQIYTMSGAYPIATIDVCQCLP